MSVRESADRLRRFVRGERFRDVYGKDFAPMEVGIDRNAVIAAYLAEHPADEDEALSTPAAIDWLDSLSRVGGDLSMITVRACDDGMHLVSGDWVSPHVATKGDVRRLAAALGIDLQEPRQ
jgi:hypothetical protein